MSFLVRLRSLWQLSPARSAAGLSGKGGRQRLRPPALYVERLESRTLLSNFFPTDNPWNQNIANAPVAANSATLVDSIGPSKALHPDFGTTYGGYYWGIPYKVVPGTQPLIPVIIDAYPRESDLQPVPFPDNANDPTSGVIEGDPLPSSQNTGDRHVLIFDQDNQILYELYNAHRPSETADGQWHADSEAVWHTDSNYFRTPGFTSADAAGLPLLPGLARYDEVQAGLIDHALRFTVQHTRSNTWAFPASHYASHNPSASLPRMGERFRLKASFDISGFSASNQVILTALKTYGMMVADNGGDWFLSGAPDPRWNDGDINLLKRVVGNAFEAVDLTPRVTDVSPSTGPTAGGTDVTITGLNFSGGAGLTQVLFDGVPAASFQINSDTQIVATSPAHSEGTVHITVSSGYGTSALVAGDQFTYSDSSGGGGGAGQGTEPPAESTSVGLFAFIAGSDGKQSAVFFSATPFPTVAPGEEMAVTNVVSDAKASLPLVEPSILRVLPLYPGRQPKDLSAFSETDFAGPLS
jgi:hypothetical protein